MINFLFRDYMENLCLSSQCTVIRVAALLGFIVY